MLAHQSFDKRIFTAKTFLKDFSSLLLNFPKMIEVVRNKKISRVFMEKIMTVTSAVNGCVYCIWFHSKMAVESGISEEQVRNMLNLQFQAGATEFETMALLYAQHFAETNRNPDHEMTRELIEYYGEETANHIFLVIRVIYFGNLYGNTWDAVLSRFKGVPAGNSNVVFELIYFLLNFPFMFPIMILLKLEKKKILKKASR